MKSEIYHLLKFIQSIYIDTVQGKFSINEE